MHVYVLNRIDNMFLNLRCEKLNMKYDYRRIQEANL